MAQKDYAPHEGLFLKVFKDKENTKHFLQELLPQGILQHADLDSLYLENTSYLDDSLRKHFSDLVFSVRMGEEEFSASKVYLLFEHKSSPESLVGMQVIRYLALQWKEMYDQGQIIGGKLPPIIPIVIYQGRGSWQARASFQDLVEQPSESFKEFIPDFSFAFFNIGQVDERKVQENVVLKFYVSIIKALDSPELRDLLPRLTQGFYKSLDKRTALEYIEIFFKYLVKSTEVVTKEDYQKALDLLPEGGENIMNTLADQWRQQGREEGREELLLEKPKWEKQAEIKATQETLIDVAADLYGPLPNTLQAKIKSIQSIENLRTVTRKIHRTNSFDEFTELVNRAAEN
jgi:predicted transposase/invertase (TIGR01784 family)